MKNKNIRFFRILIKLVVPIILIFITQDELLQLSVLVLVLTSALYEGYLVANKQGRLNPWRSLVTIGVYVPIFFAAKLFRVYAELTLFDQLILIYIFIACFLNVVMKPRELI